MVALVIPLSTGCSTSALDAPAGDNSSVSNRFGSSKVGSWHQWHTPSNMTASGYCVVKFEYDSSDAGDAWLYKLDGHELRPVELLAKQINASLDLDTVYETSTYVEVLLCYEPFYTQVLRYDMSSKSVVRNYKTRRGMPPNPAFPNLVYDRFSSSAAIISDRGPIFVDNLEGRGESKLSLESPSGTVISQLPSTVYNVALVREKTLVLDFGQRPNGDLGMVILPVDRLLGKNISEHFQPVMLMPPPR